MIRSFGVLDSRRVGKSLLRFKITGEDSFVRFKSMTVPGEALPKASTSLNVVEKKKRAKKPRKKNTMNVESEASSQQQTPFPVRLGERRLRKVKYQQRQLSPADFLLSTAENSRFTRSVWIERLEQSSSSSGRIEIVTTSQPAIVNQFHDREFSVDNSQSFRIQIQPLLVLDLNGILCHRIRRYKEPADACPTSYRKTLFHVAGTPVIPRPDVTDFLQFLDRHFCLALWTSAKRKTATALVRELVPPQIAERLLFIWGQNRCRVIESDYSSDGANFEKNLAQVW